MANLKYKTRGDSSPLGKPRVYFCCHPGDFDNYFESNNLEAYLSFIRKKLKIIDSDVTIKAIRGMGYRLEV